MRTTISDFVHWWTNPKSNPGFCNRFLRPIRYQRSGMDGEDALWLLESSPARRELIVVSDSEAGNLSLVEALYVDPVTLLRHRVRFEIVTDGDMIVSVTERSEIIDHDPKMQPMTSDDVYGSLRETLRRAAASAEEQQGAPRDSVLATERITTSFLTMYLFAPELERKGCLSQQAMVALKRLHDFLRAMPTDGSLEPDETLNTHPFWEEVRQLAAAALTALPPKDC